MWGRAAAERLAAQQRYELATNTATKLRDQIEQCVLSAPRWPRVLRQPAGPAGASGSSYKIEEGRRFASGRSSSSIPDFDRLRVNAKVHETVIDQVKAGQHVRVTVDAFPDRTLSGVVKVVFPLPDPSSFLRTEPKVYTTLIEIEDCAGDGHWPGMTARAEIVVGEREDVLRVPVGPVIRKDGN